MSPRSQTAATVPEASDPRVLTLFDVDYAIDWDALTVGASFFVPTVATPAMVAKALRPAEEALGIRLAVRARVEYDRYGARVWRTY